MKQFRTKESLEQWIHDNFYKGPDNFWDAGFSPDMGEAAKRLAAEGYNLDKLVKNGEAYEIDGHTNNGWILEDEADPEYADALRSEGRLVKRESIRGKRLKAGLSRAEMSRRFGIPVRTLENWEAGVNCPPDWAEKLIIEKLEQIKNEEDRLTEELSRMIKEDKK